MAAILRDIRMSQNLFFAIPNREKTGNRSAYNVHQFHWWLCGGRGRVTSSIRCTNLESHLKDLEEGTPYNFKTEQSINTSS